MARIESSVTAISWIPSDAIEGLTKEPFELGLFHYDDPPPDVLDDLERLRAADAFRIANELRAWIEVEDGRIVGYGHAGKAPIGATRLRIGSKDAIFPGVAFPLLRPDPTVDETSVRFVQTAGGRTALPAPRGPQALLSDRFLGRLDDPGPDHPYGRFRRTRVGRCEPVPTALDLRSQRGADGEDGAHRLQHLVPRCIR
jgi:hypothetical protein